MRRTLVSAFAACLLVPGTASARFDTPRTPPTPAPPPGPGATFVISGHGWGHGVGLSQYGALGFAQHGATYDKILAYYYRGTTLGIAPVRRVRVLLANGRKKLTIGSDVPFRVIDGAGKTHGLAAGSFTFGPGLSLPIDVADKPQPLPGPLTFVPGTTPLQLKAQYRGQIQVTVTAGKLQAIDIVPLEQYLYGVVPSEMPSSWAPEALKAQAVAARSYALSHVQVDGPFDLYPDTRSQVYRGVQAEKPTTNAAVDATAGQVVLFGAKVASTFFFSTSGGRTMSAADAWGEPAPYLVSVADPYDSISPYHDWGPLSFTAKRFQKALKLPGQVLDVQTTRNPSGRAATVVGTGSEGDVSVPAADVRRALGLRSTWFDVGALSIIPPETTAPLTYGSRAALSGIARGLSDVVLQQRLATSSAWTTVGPLQPSKDGAFAVGVKPVVTTSYRVVSGSVTAAPVRLSVAPLVRFAPVTRQTSLRGIERPVLAGTTVQVQRLAGTAWKTVATAKVDDGGSFEAQLRLVPGDYRARFAPGRGFVPGTSKVLRVLG